ncbi:hypothetical protein [Legionella cincinnatiensis]|uniref:DNA repair protein n=1 Tax=Legionella cincinnatiensis TaxID=28085 RepID=A0A378IK95_9GAMM|nr:hypothetical protein [Legionella cincinnatiensis]KTC93204.1 DNA repair protein [Legionella cincinnatiensis]STX35095.1 DNA repair protein [Legionella cincinnatiensis]
MWYLEIMHNLLDKLPIKKRKDGELFLNELFLCINKVEAKPEMEFFLGLIDKAFSKFGDKEPNSVTLTEFSRHLFGLTLLYIKSSNDLGIWSSDFIPTLDKIAKFLDIGGEKKSWIKFLNQLERDTFASLNHKVDINFDQLRIILKKYSTLKTAQAFIDACNKLNHMDTSPGFKMLVQDVNKILTSAEVKDTHTIDSLLNFSLLTNKSKSHRLDIFKSITDSYVPSPNDDTYSKPQ